MDSLDECFKALFALFFSFVCVYMYLFVFLARQFLQFAFSVKNHFVEALGKFFGKSDIADK